MQFTLRKHTSGDDNTWRLSTAEADQLYPTW